MYRSSSDYILRLSDSAYIPLDEDNADFKAYLDWLAQGNTPEPEYSAAELLAMAKERQQSTVRAAHEADCLWPVTFLGIAWNGGFDSAIKLDAARRLAEAAGSAYVKFYDKANIDHVLSQPEALQVCVAVAMDYQTKLDKKQAAFRAIENATSIPEVEAIVY